MSPLKYVAIISLSTFLAAKSVFCIEPTYQEKPLSYWIQEARSSSEEKRERAVSAMRSFGNLGELKRLLCDEDRGVRVSSAHALSEMGPAAVPILLSVAKDPGHWDADLVLSALAKIGSPSVPAVRELLRDTDMDARDFGVRIVERLGATAKAAIPELTLILSDPWAHRRAAAARALGRIGSDAASTVPMLIKLLNDLEDPPRLAAIDALAGIGTPAIPRLLDEVKRKTRSSLDACFALARMKDKAIPAMKSLLSDNDPAVQRLCADAIGWRGAKDAWAVSLLIPILGSKETSTKLSAVETLGLIGPEARTALDSLRLLLKDSSPKIQAAAVKAISLIEASPKEAAPEAKSR